MVPLITGTSHLQEEVGRWVSKLWTWHGGIHTLVPGYPTYVAKVTKSQFQDPGVIKDIPFSGMHYL